MRKVTLLIVAIVMLVMVTVAQAGRLEDLQARHKELTEQKLILETQLIQLEGMFAERRLVIEEQAAAKKAAEEAESAKVEEPKGKKSKKKK